MAKDGTKCNFVGEKPGVCIDCHGRFHCSMLDLYKEYQEEAYALAFHPSGLYVLVGFADKLRLMNLLIDDIQTFKDFTVRGCREVRSAGKKTGRRV